VDVVVLGGLFPRPNQRLPSRKNHNRAHVQNQDLGGTTHWQGKDCEDYWTSEW
jgi:hypothetical protein